MKGLVMNPKLHHAKLTDTSAKAMPARLSVTSPHVWKGVFCFTSSWSFQGSQVI